MERKRSRTKGAYLPWCREKRREVQKKPAPHGDTQDVEREEIARAPRQIGENLLF